MHRIHLIQAQQYKFETSLQETDDRIEQFFFTHDSRICHFILLLSSLFLLPLPSPLRTLLPLVPPSLLLFRGLVSGRPPCDRDLHPIQPLEQPHHQLSFIQRLFDRAQLNLHRPCPARLYRQQRGRHSPHRLRLRLRAAAPAPDGAGAAGSAVRVAREPSGSREQVDGKLERRFAPVGDLERHGTAPGIVIYKTSIEMI